MTLLKGKDTIVMLKVLHKIAIFGAGWMHRITHHGNMCYCSCETESRLIKPGYPVKGGS